MSVDNDQTKELFNLMYEVRDRTTRIETETSRLSIIEKKADEADSTANKAFFQSESNKEEIDNINSNIKWIIGIVVTIVLGVAGMAARLFI